MAFTIDDTVNQGSPPGYAPAANVLIVPNYSAGHFLPDGSQQVKTLSATGHTMAPPVSFDFPAPEIFTQDQNARF